MDHIERKISIINSTLNDIHGEIRQFNIDDSPLIGDLKHALVSDLQNFSSDLQNFSSDLQEISKDLENLKEAVRAVGSAIPNYHPWFFILTVMLAALLYRLW